MKIISGKVKSTNPISLSNAAKSLSKFALSDHGASHAVSFYIQRASDSFNQLVQLHEKLRPKKEHSFDDDDEISRNSQKMGLKFENIAKNDDISNGYLENKKRNNLEWVPQDDMRSKVKKNKNLDKGKGDQKVIKIEERIDIGEGAMEKSKKKVEDVVKNEDIRKGSRENKKSKNLDKEKDDNKLIKNEERVDIGVGEMEKAEKNELGFVKSRDLSKEEDGTGADMRKKIKNLSKVDKMKDRKLMKNDERLDEVEGEMEESKKNELDFGKNDSFAKTETEVEEVKEDGMISSDKKKKKKKQKNKGVGNSEGEDQTLIKTEQHLDIGEMEKSEKNELEFGKNDSFAERESGVEEVKEDGMISNDKKKKKKKKNKGDGEGDMGKVEEYSGFKENEERDKRKSADRDAGDNAGSAEQSIRKRVKRGELKVKSN